MKKLLRMKQVCESVGLSKSEIYRLKSLGQFPKSCPLGARAVAWDEELIERWIESKLRNGF